jgi:secreted PhoX family phosphatase
MSRISERLLGAVPLLLLAAACDQPSGAPVAPISAQALHAGADFVPLESSAQCTAGGNVAALLNLPDGYSQEVIASEPDYLDVPDMNTLNETGPQAGRFLYHPHELGSNGGVSVTDLWTGETRVLVRRADWEALDPIVWTPWGTILFAEERTASSRQFPDPDFPAAKAGLVYELDPATLAVTVRPAIGSKAHEGMRFDRQGNLYGISETNPGALFKFVPDRRGDLSSGQPYALKVVSDPGDGTGEAVWVPLDRAAVQIDADAEAARVGATGYFRPEDVEISTSTGNSRGQVLYVAVTGNSSTVRGRVLAIQLRNDGTAFVSNYVKVGENVSSEFLMPDNLALDHTGRLFIAEDPGSAGSTGQGDDIWVATPGADQQHAASVSRFASLTDCAAEPTGLYFEKSNGSLFVNIQHRGGDGLDKTLAVRRE